jgi:hypothetical protein
MLQPMCDDTTILVTFRAFRGYPICQGPLDQSGLGSSHATTTHSWHHNQHNHGCHWQKRPPSTPREVLRSMTTRPMDGGQPPEQTDIIFGGGLRLCMALKALLCSSNDELPQPYYCPVGPRWAGHTRTQSNPRLFLSRLRNRVHPC